MPPRPQRLRREDDIPEVALTSEDGQMGLAQLLKSAGICVSTSDAMRMVKQGAVKINGEKWLIQGCKFQQELKPFSRSVKESLQRWN